MSENNVNPLNEKDGINVTAVEFDENGKVTGLNESDLDSISAGVASEAELGVDATDNGNCGLCFG
ncbi:hypothetical protein R6242_06330 [Iodobacter sp. CM08]|uniref:hypothetical protein n=1 Tax=Iodobacter sp. CM08 TaxID=3085902 RepID=UPI0029822781|nr:hypothetical protein [Iodobacter sp. CM08]MDW5416188.1 hypothetical protein [Iodobacter sp. CM08]